MLRFDGRVAIVTGAGGGLGREYALLFAERGASVVVNDLGGSAFGDGKGTSAADKVVQEIRAKGGKAVANYDSVENGDKIVKTAMDNFGRIDIVVNNAGILRDKSFQNMSDLDWDLIYRVHLKGAYAVTKAAWPIMKKQNYGKIIMTSSNAGVYGNFGQANYSAAKSALIGLSHTLAQEGAKYNVFSNAIVPTAGSRLTQTVMPTDLVDALKPEYIAPMVVWLCHEKCTDNGGLFEAAAGWFGKLQYSRSEGRVLRTKNHKVVPEDVRDHWEEITNMENSQSYSRLADVTSKLVGVLQDVDSNDDAQEQNGGQDIASIAKRLQFKPLRFHYTVRDAIVYALGIGCSVEKNLQFLYENHENFSVFPTFVVVPSFGAMGRLLDVNIPGLKLDLQRLLHGEQYFEFHKTFLPDDHLTSHARIVDVLDKGNGAVILMNVEVKNQKQELVANGQYSVFFRGSGGFGGSRSSPEEKQLVPAPKRQPDAICEEKTCLQQAALYRQGSGDLNPLHIDPSFAQLAGFERPILHGLGSFGFSVRHILDKYARGDVSKLRAVKARFSAPVIPGQTLITEMWREGDRVHFQTKVKETGKVAISGAYADFRALGAGEESGNESSGGSTSAKPQLKSTEVFDELRKRLKTQPDIVKNVQAIYLYIITKDGAEAAKYTVDLKNGEGSIYEGEPKSDKPGATLTISDDDMVGLVTGKLNPQQAFMSGKLKVKGNIMLTTKLQTLMKDQSKL
jgi:3-hydroxyacyl-CoA dehydrogenase/3a,7a,12a-trihydroxy-5b-cholest-24-enoyl-CoA hydratase